MKVLCCFVFSFCLLILLYVLVVLMRFATITENKATKVYICPGGYDLEYRASSERPICIHPIQRMIEAEKRKEEEQRARIELWWKTHPTSSTTRKPAYKENIETVQTSKLIKLIRSNQKERDKDTENKIGDYEETTFRLNS